MDVLHDTMLSFMTRVEKRLSYQEGEQRKISNRIARLEQHCKLGPGFGSGGKSSSASAIALNLEGTSGGNKRRKIGNAEQITVATG